MYAERVRALLSEGLSEFDVRSLIAETNGNLRFADCLFGLVGDSDDAIGFAALRILCRLAGDNLLFLGDRSDELVDCLLCEKHVGKRRLLLSLLYKLPVSEAHRRVDFINYCFDGINSSEPNAVRALCLKHAYALTCRYRELEPELRCAVELLDCGDVPPAIEAVRRNVVSRLDKGI